MSEGSSRGMLSIKKVGAEMERKMKKLIVVLLSFLSAFCYRSNQRQLDLRSALGCVTSTTLQMVLNGIEMMGGVGWGE